MHLSIKPKAKVCSVALYALLFACFCLSANPVNSEPTTLKVEKAGFSVWLPEKPGQAIEKDGLSKYMVLKDKALYQVVLKKKEANWPTGESEELLDSLISGFKTGFSESAVKDGRESSFNFIEKVKGPGWSGKKYKGLVNSLPMLYLFGLSKHWFYTVSVANVTEDDKEALKSFQSVTFQEGLDSGRPESHLD